MRARHTLMSPVWLVTDARTEGTLRASLAALPRGAGVIFRHYHLAPPQRRAAFRHVARLCRARGLAIVLAAPARLARAWGADGCYGDARMVGPGPALVRLVTAHSLHEIGPARRARADAVLLSPVFATRSHPDGRTLGTVRFLAIARQSAVPVIALGGMTARRARRLRGHGWAAIDGLAAKNLRIPKDS